MTAGMSATASSKCGLRVYRAEAWDLRSASGVGPPLVPRPPCGSEGPAAWGWPSKPLPCGAGPLWLACLGCSSLYPGGSIFEKSKWAWPHLFIRGCLKSRQLREGKSHGFLSHQEAPLLLDSLLPQATGPELRGSHRGWGWLWGP